MLRAIIVDDEPFAVQRLNRILSESGQLQICGTFLNPLEAYEFVKTNAVDVAFLDISMPEVNGMKLSEALRELDASIDIVFATGYDHYALQAFDVSAIDYLVKPISAERVGRTLSKLHRVRGADEVPRPGIEVRLFNGLKMTRQDRAQTPIKLRSPKTEELFAFLLCKRSVSREEVIDTLWSELAAEKAWKNLNSTLYYIRKAIIAENGDHSSVIAADRNEIRIEDSGVYCDLYEFERLLRQLRQSSVPDPNLFKQAETLYTGELLRGKAYNWAGEWSRRLESQFIELLEMAAKHYAEQNDLETSLHYFMEILKLDEIREDIHHQVIQTYLKLGRHVEALRQYRELETLLRRELGSKPDPRIAEVMNKLRQ